MKKNVCLFLFILSAVAVNAQRSRIDSLYGLLQKEKTDTGKIRKMALLARAYSDAGSDSAMFYCNEALSKAEQLQFTEGALSARSILAFFLYSHKNDYATSLDLYFQNLKIEKQTGDTTRIFFDTRDVGLIYERIGDFEKEFEYVNSLNTLINSNIFKDSQKIANYKTVVNNRFGGLYDALNKPDSAKYYKLQVYQYGVSNNRLEWIALGSVGLGKICRIMNQKDSALYYYRLCLPVALKIHRNDIYRTSLSGIGETYWSTGQQDSAFYYVEKAFRLSEEGNDPDEMMTNAALLAEIYYAKNKPDSAYTFLKRSTILKDSIYSGEKISRIQSLSLKASLQKQQQEQAEKEAVAAYKSRAQTYSFVAGIAVMLIVIFILYRNNRQRQMANKKIEKAYNDLRATQAQLVQSEKMASLGELTAGIAHEIQNPLNFVNNFSDVNKELIAEMRQEIISGNYDEVNFIAADIEANEEKINHHGKRADAIVKGMLQHSRTNAGQKEMTDINVLCDEYLRLSYHGLRAKDKNFNADIKTVFDESLSAGNADIGKINIVPQDIGRVLLNLYNNAFYAVKQSISINHEHYHPIVKVSTKKIGNKVEIKVADNGNGIPEKVVAKIFQPFFTTKPTGEGTGLGLSLSYDIIKAHGGEIKVETKEGEGSEFIILLPVV